MTNLDIYTIQNIGNKSCTKTKIILSRTCKLFNQYFVIPKMISMQLDPFVNYIYFEVNLPPINFKENKKKHIQKYTKQHSQIFSCQMMNKIHYRNPKNNKKKYFCNR
jgi:hypothetical protein